MNNMSDGKSDGFVIMYCKDGIIYPVGLTKEQIEMLDISMGMCFQSGLKVFEDKPIGQITTLKKGD